MPDEPEALDASAVADGLCACAQNAKKLFEDAARLYSRHRYATALFLGIASLEECGKAHLLLLAAATQQSGMKVNWSQFWKSFRSHDVKGNLASVLDLTLYGEEAAPLAVVSLFLQELPRLRKSALYVDRADSAWALPGAVSKELVYEVLGAAEALSEDLVAEFNKRRLALLRREVEALRLPLRPEKNPSQATFLEGANTMAERLLAAFGRANVPHQPQFT